MLNLESTIRNLPTLPPERRLSEREQVATPGCLALSIERTLPGGGNLGLR